MGVPDRYERLAQRDDRAGVLTYEGIDSVSGLPVLIHEFDGEPLAGPELDSENLPPILWSGSHAGRATLVAGLETGWRQRSSEEGPLRAVELLGAARALRDASAAGLAHGDIRPERLLKVDERLQIEGYGVPWPPAAGAFTAPELTDSATERGDVWSLAKVAGSLGLAVNDDTVDAVLALCSAAEPEDRPSAEELYLALERLLASEAADEPSPAARVKGARTGTSPSKPPAAKAPAAAKATPPAKASLVGKGSPAAKAQAVVKAPAHPASTAPSQAADDLLTDPRERRVRLAMLGVLIAAVVALALLALYGPRAGRVPATAGREATVYVVQVYSAPEDLPPVTIHLVSSPAGSKLARGDRLGTAPRHLALDRPGTWAFQGSLQDRRSEVVEIRVPEERSFTLTIPAEGGG